LPEAKRRVRITPQFLIWDHTMKYASIFLLSASLLSGVAVAGSNTEAAVGGALGGALGSVVGEHLGGSTGATIGAGVGGAAGGMVGADKRSRTEAAIGGGLGAAGGNVIGQKVGGSTGGLIGAAVGGGAGGAIGNAYGDDDDRYRGDRRYRDSHYYGPPGKAKGHYKHRHKHH
jgi:hypothetical protein